jgi:uncharacterized membrane protein YbaN (DUF454 family)
MLKPILFVIAWISFALGIIGAFLPILPTTPFLILSAYLFSKSSPRFHAWILTLPVAGDGIRDWRENRVIKTKAKVLAISMMVLSIVSIWISDKIALPIQILVTLTLVSVGTFVGTRKSG